VTEAGAGDENAQAADSDEPGWHADYLSWRRARLQRVQDSARVWLGVLTTLVGLLGSVVLFKGGDLVTGVTDSGWFQAGLVVLIFLVFASAVLALVAGGMATWGGLADIVPPAEQPGAVPGPEPGGPRAPYAAAGRWRGRRSRWLWRLLAGKPAAGRPLLTRGELRAAPGEPWQKYKAESLNTATLHRAYLHASRRLGIVTAALIAALAVLAIISGTIAPAPADVIVIHSGRSACVPAGATGAFTHVSQVIPVSSC
jgi:hypothetical protein